MSFLIKQAINDLSSETSDIQVVLSRKADVAQTYTKFDTYSTAEVDDKFKNMIDSAPATLNTERARHSTERRLLVCKHCREQSIQKTTASDIRSLICRRTRRLQRWYP